ncbi:hypothetical protein [Nonomuraea candida]|uniref:hypothetical protein n=1 Tax=Nonomuraea candida TaxID=359159 RepID=UPI0005BD774A|nr:hypothetical protein [Nonomuraea candida]
MPDKRPLRDDLQATLDARRDLGPEYEAALVESFVDRLDVAIAARVQAELGRHGAAPGKRSRPETPMIPIVLGSLGIGVPLTAIGGTTGGPVGLLVVWLSIVVINVAAAAAVMRRGQGPRW